MEELRRIAQPLYGFVYKYFEKLKPEAIPELTYEYILSTPELFQLVKKAYQCMPEAAKNLHSEADEMDFWAHKELLLKTLVVITNIPFMYAPLQKEQLLEEAVIIRDELIDGFTNKAIEDPNVLQAIQSGTIDEEIEKRKESKELYNFKPLFEIKGGFVINPEGVNFEEIPDRF